ncbi:MAG: hypothetical protein EXR98_14785 [Gemmataceae bacterium]|nr:hypothetical protein [Gemmataceae bacterium]
MPSRIPTFEVVDDRMAEILAKKTDTERLAMVDQMWRFARDLVRDNLRREHPELTADELDRMVARRLSHGAV